MNRTECDGVIFALASGRANAAISIIRVTGKSCLDHLVPCLPQLSAAKPRYMRRSNLIDPTTTTPIDDVMWVFFQNPSSFTGEDTVEIFCHGGTYIVGEICRILSQLGIRAAEPGEFTRRAFLNGKMDLTQAEGIRELIEAQSHQQWLAARQLASGKLAVLIEDLRKELIRAMALLEARIDFPDEGDVAGVGLVQVDSHVETVRTALVRLRGTYDGGRVARQGLTTVFVGAPNAGKSTLLNTLLDRERAIVTPHAGTTRDYIEESLIIAGRLLRIIDTAGIRETTDTVEKIGVEATARLAQEADLVVFLVAGDEESGVIDNLRNTWIPSLKPKDYLIVTTKADLGIPSWHQGSMVISCHTGTGLDELRQALVKKVDDQLPDMNETTVVTTIRHRDAIDRGLAAIAAYQSSRQRGEFDELLAFELQQANRHLRSIVGHIDGETLLDEIFSSFCIGK